MSIQAEIQEESVSTGSLCTCRFPAFPMRERVVDGSGAPWFTYEDVEGGVLVTNHHEETTTFREFHHDCERRRG